jgi:hypothetical protein
LSGRWQRYELQLNVFQIYISAILLATLAQAGLTAIERSILIQSVDNLVFNPKFEEGNSSGCLLVKVEKVVGWAVCKRHRVEMKLPVSFMKSLMTVSLSPEESREVHSIKEQIGASLNSSQLIYSLKKEYLQMNFGISSLGQL